MGFRSGDLAGQATFVIPTSSKHYILILATCDRTLSCIKTAFSPSPAMLGITCSSGISVMYLRAVRDPFSMKGNSVWKSEDIPPQAMTEPPPNGILGAMQACENRSPVLLQTLTRPSDPVRQKRDSSENNTLLQSLIPQCAYCRAKASRATRGTRRSGGPLAITREDSQEERSLLLTVATLKLRFRTSSRRF
jgi:hypothetical protein